MNPDLIIAGWGAVSPAGWTAGELADAVLDGRDLPVFLEKRHPEVPALPCRRVPAPAAPPPWLRHPRLRRASPITRFAVAAALEALRRDPAAVTVEPAGPSLGIVFAVQNGGVNFSRRFYAEVLDNPGLASPILFPETVFNAPSSHLASLLAAPALNNTLVGDAGGFLVALDMAAQWLGEGRVSDCLVVAADEYDWLSAEALDLFPGQKTATEGSAALWLRRAEAETPAPAGAVVLEQITETLAITRAQPRAAAIRRMKAGLDAPPDAALVSAASGSAAWDRPHQEAFAGWSGPRFTLQEQFGHPFVVLGGWQCALACELLRRGLAKDAVIPADTGASQVLAAWLRCNDGGV